MSGKRRVLIIVENLPVPFDRRVWTEATTLRDAGYEVSIICPKGLGAQENYILLEGIHVHRHPLPKEGHGALAYAIEYSAALFFETWLAARIFATRGFDVIHACNPPDTIFLIAGLFRLFGVSFVFDHHDINPELYEAKFGKRGLGYNLLLLLERMTFRTADVCIATNQSYLRIALERGKVRPDRAFIVRSGPKLDRLRDVPPQSELKRGAKHLVGYVGVIGEQEGIDLLLLAMRHILTERGRSDIHFGIVGGGPALESMKKLAVSLGVDKHVTFTGRVPDQALLDMLCTSDVCVNPDRVNDMNDKSTMNKIMEYMALGKPIVQFDLKEGRFSAGDASLYAAANDPEDFGDKIVELLDDPERARTMGEFGRKRVHQELSWDREAPHLMAAYDKVFELRAQGGAQSVVAVVRKWVGELVGAIASRLPPRA